MDTLVDFGKIAEFLKHPLVLVGFAFNEQLGIKPKKQPRNLYNPDCRDSKIK